MKNLLLSFATFLTLSSPLAATITVPELSSPTMDTAGLLTASQKRSLDELLRTFQPEVQLSIWVLPKLEGEPIESVGIRAAEKWKLGTEKKDNGVILLVALEDRRMRIEVGQGLEGAIPDAMAGRLIDHVLKPAFQRQQFLAGLKEASIRIYELAGGSYSGARSSRAQQAPDWIQIVRAIFILLAFLLVFGSPLLAFLGIIPRSRWSAGGGGIGRAGFGGGWSGSGRGWGGGGWSGGGGGWSGGGGGFSGGGSSGSW